jgi:sec-independent protein translocase protein TatB
MFGIGFSELIIILIIALVVVGPERLPGLARQAGSFVRQLRQMYNQVREQARAELGPDFDEFERNLHELRALDPRQQVRDFGRSMLNDLSADAPEIKQAMSAPKLNLDQIGRSVLQDDLLDRPLSESLKPSADSAAPSQVTANGVAAPPPSPDEPVAAPAATPQPETTGHYE